MEFPYIQGIYLFMDYVVLSHWQIFRVDKYAAVRISEAKRLGRRDHFGLELKSDAEAFEMSRQSVAAEMAFAIARNAFFDPLVDLVPGAVRPADVDGMEVRWTKYEHGCLWIKEDDPDDRVCVLVTGWIPAFRIVGWLLAGIGKQTPPTRKRPDRPPGIFIDQRYLNRFVIRAGH